MLHFKPIAILMHDVLNNLLPLDISNLVTYFNDIHDYNTRFSSNDNFYVKYSCFNKMNNSFLRTRPRIWNNIPSDLRNLLKNKFKTTLQKVLISILVKGGYVDVATLINTLKR